MAAGATIAVNRGRFAAFGAENELCSHGGGVGVEKLLRQGLQDVKRRTGQETMLGGKGGRAERGLELDAAGGERGRKALLQQGGAFERGLVGSLSPTVTPFFRIFFWKFSHPPPKKTLRNR